MAGAEAALEKMREVCLSLPDTREGSHFEERVFYVHSKLFASFGEKHGQAEITFGLEPDHAEALVKSDPRFKPYPRDKRGVVLNAADVKTWSEVKALITASYELMTAKKAAKKPAKKKPASEKAAPGKKAAAATRRRR